MDSKPLNVLDSLLAIIVVPIIIVIAIIVIPPLLIVFFIITTIEKLSNKIKLRKILKLNNGKVYFIYADYNNYDF